MHKNNPYESNINRKFSETQKNLKETKFEQFGC
jgi:hypothetical protein